MHYFLNTGNVSLCGDILKLFELLESRKKINQTFTIQLTKGLIGDSIVIQPLASDGYFPIEKISVQLWCNNAEVDKGSSPYVRLKKEELKKEPEQVQLDEALPDGDAHTSDEQLDESWNCETDSKLKGTQFRKIKEEPLSPSPFENEGEYGEGQTDMDEENEIKNPFIQSVIADIKNGRLPNLNGISNHQLNLITSLMSIIKTEDLSEDDSEDYESTDEVDDEQMDIKEGFFKQMSNPSFSCSPSSKTKLIKEEPIEEQQPEEDSGMCGEEEKEVEEPINYEEEVERNEDDDSKELPEGEQFHGFYGSNKDKLVKFLYYMYKVVNKDLRKEGAALDNKKRAREQTEAGNEPAAPDEDRAGRLRARKRKTSICYQCCLSFDYEALFWCHLHDVHDKKSKKEKPFACGQCNFRTTKQGYLNNHVRRKHQLSK